MKRIIAIILTLIMILTILPAPAFARETGTVTVENEYIRVTVSRENGGYTISTKEGDILKKTDNNKALTHRGENFDTSFTSFQIDGDSSKEYIFGNDYGLLGMASTPVVTASDSAGVTSTWSVNDLEVTQRIELVNSDSSEQLGTAIISYTVKNKSSKSITLKSRVLIDTQLGEKDFGYYEVTKGALGGGYSLIERETALSGAEVPADYFVKDSAYQPEVAAFGVNSVIADDKPYQMIFAHWANIAATKFDYTPDNNLTFSNAYNDHRTADSAAALYYNLGSIPAGGERSFSTYYGVTANLKNKDNQVPINTTAPSKLTFNETRTAFIGSSGKGDNIIRINTTITNPAAQNKSYKKLAVVVYTIGFTAQRQTDSGSWIVYDNNDPLYTDVVNFGPGRNLTTFFDFRFEPRDNHELGSFVTRVYNMDPEVNELGVYADNFCLGETINYIFIPAKNPELPSITLHSMEPGILFNDDRRFLTVSGQGMSFFKSGLSAIELRGEDKTYSVPVSNMNIAQDAKSISILLEDYMEPGRYQLHFLWDGSQPGDIPADFTSSAMTVHMTSDESYRNDKYGVLTVQRNGDTKYKIVAYEDETAFEQGDNASGDGYKQKDLIFVLRGELVKDKDEDKKEYRLAGKDKDVTINHILNYHGSDLVVKESESGSVEILMDGKITTIGANTTVRNGSAVFRLESGTKYIIPVYDSRGEVVSGGSLEVKEDYEEDYIELRWNNYVDILQTIGGFLIDLKYGVLGKIQDEDDESKTYEIISFGGGLDLSFMTPGGAKKAREDKSKKSKESSWDISGTEDKSGLDPGSGSGPQEEKKDATKETTKKDKKGDDDKDDDDDDDKVEFGAHVYDVLYGQNGKKTGFIGINMDANITLPHLVGFLPEKFEGKLSVNTIGGYNVGVEGEVETAKFTMGYALVVKSNPSGAPIPDKLFFSIGGFKPGVNIDGLGIVWITGGGGGFDNLYETIYGTDGVPPITLLLNVQFDIFKIMTGTADLELSLRSFGMELSDVKLKAVKNAKFLESGEVNYTWYPNYDFSTRAKVNFAKVFKGDFSINANPEKLYEMKMRVTLHIPEDVPAVGGMEVGGAELGGGAEKMWGSVDVLDGIKVGFIYWWDSGNVKFTTTDIVSSRSLKAFKSMTEPKQVELDPATGKGQYMAFGTNLSYIAGTMADSNLTEEKIDELKSGASDPETGTSDSTMLKSGLGMGTFSLPATSVVSNREQTSHIVTFGTPEGDYILTVGRADGKALASDFANHIKVWNNGEEFPLIFYESPGIVAGLDPDEELSDDDKARIKSAAETANVNVVGNVAYIAIPKSKQSNPTFLIQFDDGRAYDVGAVFVSPMGELKNLTSSVTDGKLNVNWTAENVSDKAVVSVSVSDEEGEAGILLANNISAKSETAEIVIPNTVASGTYYVTVVLQDEDKCYNSYSAGTVDITDVKAPTAPTGASLSNAGNNKLLITVTDDFEKDLLEGYYVDVYEDGKLIEAGVFFGKDQVKNGQALIGGRYYIPIMEEYTDPGSGETKYRQKTDGKGEGLFREAGYEPGRSYSVKVRAGSSESTADGDLYHYSGYVRSNAVVLEAATSPVLSISASGAISVGKDGVDFALTKNTNTFSLKANEPVKGTLTVNGAAGETYSFDSEWKTEWTRELTLTDGIYYLEFDAADQAGNRSIQQAVVNIDTTAPVIMLESPVNGGTFTNNEIFIKGVADPNAKYTFKVDGVTIGDADRDMSAYFSKGVLEYTLSMGDAAAQMTPAKRMFEIIAKDELGNTETKRMEIVDGRMSDIVRVEIYADGRPVSSDGILLNSDNSSATLQLMGFTQPAPSGGGQIIDISEAANVSFTLAAGSNIALSNRTLSASKGGSSMVLASLDLGGGSALTDGVMVKMDVYSELNAAISQAKAIQKGDYTDATWSALQNAILQGESLINNSPDAEQEQINSAIAAIRNAIAGLKRTEWSDPGDWSDPTEPDKPTKPGEEENQEPGTEDNGEMPFRDVRETDWFYDDVAFVFSSGLFNGISQNEFAPQMTMNRAMLATIIYRLDTLFRTAGENGTNEAAERAYENPFNDVPEGEYFSDAVKWAAANDIFRGTGNGIFEPSGEITREQMAVILYRYLKYAGIEYVVSEEYISFEDESSISDFAKEAVQVMNKLGIIRGIGDGKIAPKNSATRAEVSAMLHRFIEMFFTL